MLRPENETARRLRLRKNGGPANCYALFKFLSL